MNKNLCITTFKLHHDWNDDFVVTKRPFTKEEKIHIVQNIQAYKGKNEDWEDRACDLMDYAVLMPFKSIVVEVNQEHIQVLD